MRVFFKRFAAFPPKKQKIGAVFCGKENFFARAGAKTIDK